MSNIQGLKNCYSQIVISPKYTEEIKEEPNKMKTVVVSECQLANRSLCQ